MGVTKRFSDFLSNITLTDDQLKAGRERRESVIQALNENYYGSKSKTDQSKFIGSWGKFTRVRPPRDVDVLFELPKAAYDRFQQRNGNKQSQLLQEVRSVLGKTFYSTTIKGDGPVVMVDFSTYNVEIVPAFLLTSGQYWICMTDDGGRYKTADYDAEISNIAASNDKTSNTRDLVRMAKAWQSYCSVPLKSFHLELVAVDFLNQWEHAGKGKEYYDWMMRDFFGYLANRKNSHVYAPGTYEAMYLGESWVSRAETARDRATKACGFETTDALSAGDEWQKIFGTDVPRDA